jgi:hypothetical protein
MPVPISIDAMPLVESFIEVRSETWVRIPYSLCLAWYYQQTNALHDQVPRPLGRAGGTSVTLPSGSLNVPRSGACACAKPVSIVSDGGGSGDLRWGG